ncbi:protein spinster-like [Acanthaster planci]|uniref:Protein spinster-like n=1 Tax=Acanthaster planci TaxID=133434 RepID=A0A8B7ZJK5_ACAPL|nr:protein spinster-like [Acanthaster planci]XP_022105202.1 protein spinster-like [Acanthaster planci]XP_022105203.1 protein spinster-like [Acanthaster planci]
MGQSCCRRNREVDGGGVHVPTVPTWKVVASLLLTFAVYIGVQVVGQAYPVLIPAGMRCYQNHTYVCQDRDNKSLYSTPVSAQSDCHASAGCIEFSDALQGILTGVTFTSVYFVAGIPLARAASTGSRVLVLAVGQLFLVAMAVVTAVSDRFLVLWLARLGVGFGEAACSPAAYSLISDYFLAMNRAKALSFYYFATNFGVAVAYLLGLVNSYLCWRWVFYCLAIAGSLLFLLILMFLREPLDDSYNSLLNSRDTYTLKETAYRLISNKPYVVLCSASSARYISMYTLWAWLPTFYAKVLRIPSEEYGVNVALVVLCGGGAGCLIGGVLAHRISRHRKQYKAYLIAASQLAAAPFIVGTLLLRSSACSFGLLFLACLTAEIAPGPAASTVQDLFAESLRSQALAAYIAISNIIGGAVGPILIPGIIAFRLSWHDCDQGVGVALAIVVPIFYLLASVLYTVTACLMPSEPILSEETIYLKYETSEVDPGSDDERETLFYGSQSC